MHGNFEVLVQEATYKGGYDIHVQFEDGVASIIHLNDLVENGIFIF